MLARPALEVSLYLGAISVQQLNLRLAVSGAEFCRTKSLFYRKVRGCADTRSTIHGPRSDPLAINISLALPVGPDVPLGRLLRLAKSPTSAEVLITSATDALAFLVGATTVLPALGWFCTYAGNQ